MHTVEFTLAYWIFRVVSIRVDNTSEQAQVRGQEPEVPFSLIRKFNFDLRFPM